jgi:hypothetical protein
MIVYYNNKKLALSIFWVVLGAVLMALTVTKTLDSEIYSGMGGGLIAVGILQITRNLKYRRDPAFREKIDTAERDERLSFIRMKSWSWTGYVLVLVCALASVVTLVLGEHTLQLVFSYAVCLILLVYWVSFLILSKKY